MRPCFPHGSANTRYADCSGRDDAVARQLGNTDAKNHPTVTGNETNDVALFYTDSVKT